MKKIMFIALLGIVATVIPTKASAESEQWQYGQGISIQLKNGEQVTIASDTISDVLYVGNIGFKVLTTTSNSHDYLYSQILSVTYLGQGEEPPAPDNNINRNTMLNKCPEAWRLEFPHMRETGNQSYVTKRTTDYGITYSAEWDNDKIANRWSVYEMYEGNMYNNCNRKDDFKEDPDLPSNTRSRLSDYSGSGYARGHLCPSADRLCSDEQNKQTFFLSNMQPQWQSHNGGQWGSLEDKVRTWAEQCDTLYVVKAATIDDITLNEVTESGVYSNTYNGRYYADLVCNDRLPVAKYFYMALMKYNKKTGSYSAVGIWTKHFNNGTKGADGKTHDWPVINQANAEYITIDELEQRTGIDFFCNLPDDVEATVEATYNSNDWR